MERRSDAATIDRIIVAPPEDMVSVDRVPVQPSSA